jgi:hypothetical protein
MNINRRFGGRQLLHLRGQRVRKARNQHEAGSCLASYSALSRTVLCMWRRYVPLKRRLTFHKTPLRYTPEGRILHNHRCDNLKSNNCFNIFLSEQLFTWPYTFFQQHIRVLNLNGFVAVFIRSATHHHHHHHHHLHLQGLGHLAHFGSRVSPNVPSISSMVGLSQVYFWAPITQLPRIWVCWHSYDVFAVILY